MKPGAKFLNSLFEVAHVEFQTYDLSDHRVIFSSGIVRQLLGYTHQEYTTLSDGFYSSIIHPDDFGIVQQTINKLLKAQNGEVIAMTIRLRKIDGQYIWLYSRQMVYERNDDGRITTIIREVEDVTNLINLQDELEDKVAQLREVSFKNSHLLRSPVASIIGLVDLIEDQAVTGEHNRQILQFLKETITRLDSVIHEINDVIR